MKRRFWATVLALCMVLGMPPGKAWAAETGPMELEEVGEAMDSRPRNSSEGISYEVMGGNIYSYSNIFYPRTREITGCDSSVTSADIPDSINGATITGIGDGAFWGCSGLKNVSIPNSVTTIGEKAFYECSGLKNMTIPDSVTRIDMNAFSGCSSLTNVTIPGSAWIGFFAFSNCTGLKSLTISNGVTYIGDGAFWGCSGLKNVSIPNSVRTIGDNAFANCSALTNVTIPDSVTNICEGAFKGCSGLTNVTIPDSVTTIGESVFEDCSNLTNVAICDGVTSIGDHAFRGCSDLARVTIPASVTQFGGFSMGMFDDCSSLISAGPIGGGYNYEFGWTDKIPAYAFSGCGKLASVTIPSSITSIGAWAFNHCNSLTDVYYGGSKELWKANALSLGVKEVTIHYNSTGPDQPDDPNPPTPPEDTESKLFFCGYWDATNKIMKPTTIAMAGGYTITDKTAISGASSVEELENHYVMVDKEKSSSGLWPEAVRIRLLETRIGKVTSLEQAGKNQYKVIIDGSEYTITSSNLFPAPSPTPPTNSAFGDAQERFLNRTVLCIFDGGELVRLDSLQFAAGTIKNSGSGIFKLEPLVTLETEMTTDVRGTQQYHAVCADTVSSIPTVGSAAGCYWNSDGVLAKIDERTYQTKVGTLGMYEGDSDMTVIDDAPVHVNAEEWEWNKNTEREPDIGNCVGKKVFYLLANGEIVHMDSLEKIEYKLTATYPGAGIVAEHVTYQNGSFVNPETTNNKTILATISYKPSNYPFLKPYDRETVYSAIEKPLAITLESAYWEEGNGFTCKGPEVKNRTLNPGDKAELGFKVTIKPGFVPPYASQIVENRLHIEGIRADGVSVPCEISYLVEVVNKDYNSSDPDEPPADIDETELTAWEKGLLADLYKIEDVDVSVDNGTYALSQYFNKSTISDIGRIVVFWRAAMESKLAKETKGTMPENLRLECTMTQGRYNGHKATLLFHVKSYLDWSTAMFKDISLTLVDNKTNATLVEDELYSVHVQGSPRKFADGIQSYLKAEYDKEFVKFCKKLGKKAIQSSITDIAKITGKEYLNTMLDMYKNIDIMAETAKKYFKYAGKASKILKNPIDAAVADASEIDKCTTKLSKVECPVDVYIYNPAGELCGSIENNTIVVDTTEVFMGVDGDAKSMWLNDDYTIRLVATGDGNMNYSIQEYRGTSKTRTVSFDEVPLAVGITYEGNIPEKPGVSADKYSLKSNKGETILADRDTETNPFTPGDLNGDGKVTMADVIRLARGAANYVTLTEQEQTAGDVTGDGKITMADVIRVARFAAGYSTTL